MLSTLMGALIESLTLVLFFWWAGYRYLNRPLRALTLSVSKVAQGQLEEAKMQNIGNDNTEIEVLSRTFNNMIDKVVEAKKMQEAFVQAEKMTSLGQLAAGMAHEINSPLAGIIQNLQNIQRRLDPDIAKNQQDAQLVGVDLEKFKYYLEKREILKFLDSIKLSESELHGLSIIYCVLVDRP